MPGIVTPDPNDAPNVYVLDTALPSASTIEKWVVSLLSFLIDIGLIAEGLLDLLKLMVLFNSFVLVFDRSSLVGTLKCLGSPTADDLLLCPLLIASERRWYVITELLLYLFKS